MIGGMEMRMKMKMKTCRTCAAPFIEAESPVSLFIACDLPRSPLHAFTLFRDGSLRRLVVGTGAFTCFLRVLRLPSFSLLHLQSLPITNPNDLPVARCPVPVPHPPLPLQLLY